MPVDRRTLEALREASSLAGSLEDDLERVLRLLDDIADAANAVVAATDGLPCADQLADLAEELGKVAAAAGTARELLA
jgi:predicted regulator of Ras-like GTPase activity (Roadblock/LC7/MglB family)